MKNKLIPEKVRKSEFIRNFLTLVSATSVAQGIALIIYPVLTRIYTPEEHGVFALYLSIISVTAIVSSGKYDLAILMPAQKRESLSLVMLSTRICIYFSLFLVIPVLFFNKPLAEILGNQAIGKWLYLVPLSTLLVGLFQIISVWANREKKFKLIAGANLSQSLLNSGVKVSTSSFLPGGGGLIVGALIGQITGALVYIWRFLRAEKKEIKTITRAELRNSAKKYSLFPKYNLFHYLVNNFSSNLPIFALSAWFSMETTGLYSLAFTMINRPMSLVTNSIGQVLAQRVIEKFNKGHKVYSDIRSILLRMFFIGIGPFLLTGLFGPQIFAFVFDDRWYQAGKFMQLLLPWLFLVFLSSPVTFLTDMFNQQKKAMWIDNLKFILRIVALSVGILLKDVRLAIILFSAVSFVVVVYYFSWSLSLAYKHDLLLTEKQGEKQ